MKNDEYIRLLSIDVISDLLDSIGAKSSILKKSREVCELCDCIFTNQIASYFGDLVQRNYLPNGDLFLDYKTPFCGSDQDKREADALLELVDVCESSGLIYDVTIAEGTDIATGLNGLQIQCKIRAEKRAVYIL